ncbi:MAG: phage tail protein [Methylococcaceae bacterium]|nr:phage tail protein [Methylococcaceae bacterium]
MADPFIGEIRRFAGNYAPEGWALCQGQLLAVAENDVLYSLIGTTYGGDGVTSFALPDLQGRIPLHQGSGPGLSPKIIGEAVGAEAVTLMPLQLPQHSHPAVCANTTGNSVNPVGLYWSTDTGGDTKAYSSATTSLAPMGGDAITSTGGGQAHDNMQPYLVLNYIIAVVGIYPSPS